jgi:hypothetical protein
MPYPNLKKKEQKNWIIISIFSLLTLFKAGFRSKSTPLIDERDFVDGRYSSVTVTVYRFDCWK